MTSKAQFLKRRTIARLPPKEQERRWKQHQRSVSSGSGATPRERVVVRLPQQANVSAERRCVKDYVRLLADPFMQVYPAPCLPVSPALPSQKEKYFARVTGYIGTAGFGFVVAGAQVAQDSGAAIHYSTAAYAGTTCALTPTAGVGSAIVNTPFILASFGSSTLEWRTIAMGVRVRYSGTNLNKAGYSIPLETPHHHTCNGLSESGFLSFDRAGQVPVSHENWAAATYQPVTPGEYNFTNVGATTDHFLGIVVIGTPGEPFSIEFHEFIELLGSSARSKTETPAYDNLAKGATARLAQLPSNVLSFFDPEKVVNYAMQIGGPLAWEHFQNIGGRFRQRMIA